MALSSIDVLVIILEGLIYFALFFTAVHFLKRYVLGYRLTKERLTVVFAGIPIYWTDLESISDIYRIRAVDLFHPLLLWGALGFGNRFGNWVLVTRKRGFVRFIVITPSDPEQFMRCINGRQPLPHG